MRHLLSLLLLLAACNVIAKDKEHTLSGTIKIKGGDTYPYRLVFTASHNTIKGYSITKLPDNTESKTSITGMINRQKKALVFAETKMLSELPKDATICYINALISYKKKGNNYIFSGIFAGKDGEQQECGTGTVEFIQPVAQDDLYAADTTAKQIPLPPMETGNNERKAGKDEVTAGVERSYDWNTDSCTLEVWDGGVIDGDVISLLVNDERVLNRYTLSGEKKVLHFPVSKKINTITVIAEDEGSNPPNTVQLIFHDGDERYKLTAFNKKGAKAVVIINRK